MVVVLGAGIAGLASANELLNQGFEYSLFEKDMVAGGLLKNFTVDGYRFDHAIHLSFATEKEVRKVFDQTPVITHRPEATCFEDNIYLRHPVQNNLYPLSVEEKVELVASFISRPDDQVGNYREWLLHQYGDQIAERYPVKYTKKYWDCEPEHLGLEWIGNRMHRPSVEQVLEGAFTDNVPNYYYAKEMRYPAKGGYASFLNPLLKEVQVNTGYEVSRIDVANKKISFENKVVVSYEHLINTIPLPILVSKTADVPKAVADAAERLEWTRIHIVSFGFNRKVNFKSLWSYIYDEDIYASRVYSPSWKSPDNCPEGTSSLQFEIYESSRRGSDRYNGSIKNCRYALEKMFGIKSKDIVVEDIRVMPFGNVVFYSGMEKDRQLIIDFYAERGVIGAGRFGEWDYLWSNQSYISGVDAAAKVTSKLTAP